VSKQTNEISLFPILVVEKGDFCFLYNIMDKKCKFFLTRGKNCDIIILQMAYIRDNYAQKQVCLNF
jgi:predicted nucleic acid-binding Zn finger protein